MGDLHVIRGDKDGKDPQLGSVEHALKFARESCNDENTEIILIIALRKPYPAEKFNGTIISSVADPMRLFGLVQWLQIKLYDLLGR